MASNIERSDQRLQLLIRLEQAYRQVIAENARIEQDLGGRGQDFTLFAFLEAQASRDGLKKQIEYMRPSVKSLSDTHQEDHSAPAEESFSDGSEYVGGDPCIAGSTAFCRQQGSQEFTAFGDIERSSSGNQKQTADISVFVTGN